jgi:hypothetical protein
MAREDYPIEWLLQGDINGDGIIDSGDLGMLGLHYKQPASVAPECDLDCDGWISVLDLEKMRRNWGLTYEKWVEQLKGRLNKMVAITVVLSAIPLVFIGGETVGRRVT